MATTNKRRKAAPQRRKESRRGTTYRAGRATREAIVQAAESVLTDLGHAQFSVQRVAARAGITPGNLNYYFPTRAALLEALIRRTLTRYRRRVLALGASGGGRPAEFGAALRWLTDDAVSGPTNSLFRQLWAIAASDARVAAAMDRFYSNSVRGHLRRLGVRTAAAGSYLDLEAIMYLVLVVSEGSTVLFGTRARSAVLFRRVQAMAVRAVADLVASVEA